MAGRALAAERTGVAVRWRARQSSWRVGPRNGRGEDRRLLVIWRGRSMGGIGILRQRLHARRSRWCFFGPDEAAGRARLCVISNGRINRQRERKQANLDEVCGRQQWERQRYATVESVDVGSSVRMGPTKTTKTWSSRLCSVCSTKSQQLFPSRAMITAAARHKENQQVAYSLPPGMQSKMVPHQRSCCMRSHTR